MKSYYLIVLILVFLLLPTSGYCQTEMLSENKVVTMALDSNKVNMLIRRAEEYYFNKPDTCLIIAREAIELARTIKFTNGELAALNKAGEALRFLGEYPAALEMQFEALEISKKIGNKSIEANSLGFIGFIYTELKENREALKYLFQADRFYKEYPSPIMEEFNLSNIGTAYTGMDMLDSALFFQKQAEMGMIRLKHENLKTLIFTRLGIVHSRLGNSEIALIYFHKALQKAFQINDQVNPSKIQYQIANLYLSLGQLDSSFYYATRAFDLAKRISQKAQLLDASEILAQLFKRNDNLDSAIYYQDIFIAMKDQLYGAEKVRQIQLFALKEQQKNQEIIQENEKQKSRVKIFGLLVILVFILAIAILLFRNNRQKQVANILLERQKGEIERSYNELKLTQAQLIESEKMASLGELTAGIAHEIQNPLNFVNNFSEVSNELIKEVQDLRQKTRDHSVKSEEDEILNDIAQNLAKINHHGQRASNIVKSMLQHSRTSTGQKEPTDINSLAEEYLRLAYHGLRAKDKSFNANFITNLDPSLPKMNVVAQDIGRVLLNLINNAFYAVDKKAKSGIGEYKPEVIVVTKLSTSGGGKGEQKVQISVKDNGDGIPQQVRAKIFQPFFTTKPTGQGTGLGLSLSYDIVKAHGGELKVETKEGEGSEFIIQLRTN